MNCLRMGTWAATSLPKSVMSTYKSALNHLDKFHKNLRFIDKTYTEGPLDTIQTRGFIWYLGHHLTKSGASWISPGTVRKYWNILTNRLTHLAWRAPLPKHEINNIIRCIRNNYIKKPRTRFPLTAQHLAIMQRNGPSHYTTTLPPKLARQFTALWPATLAITATGIFGLARKRELLHVKKDRGSKPERNLKYSQIAIKTKKIPQQATGWTVARWWQANIPWSKTEQMNPSPIVAGEQKGRYREVCPLRLWSIWCTTRETWSKAGNETPFIQQDGSPYWRELYNRLINIILRKFNVNREIYGNGGFSLRKGGGNSLAAHNLPDELLQRLGRWTSIAVRRYRTFSPFQRVQVSRWFSTDYDASLCVFKKGEKTWNPSTDPRQPAADIAGDEAHLYHIRRPDADDRTAQHADRRSRHHATSTRERVMGVPVREVEPGNSTPTGNARHRNNAPMDNPAGSDNAGRNARIQSTEVSRRGIPPSSLARRHRAHQKTQRHGDHQHLHRGPMVIRSNDIQTQATTRLVPQPPQRQQLQHDAQRCMGMPPNSQLVEKSSRRMAPIPTAQAGNTVPHQKDSRTRKPTSNATRAKPIPVPLEKQLPTRRNNGRPTDRQNVNHTLLATHQRSRRQNRPPQESELQQNYLGRHDGYSERGASTTITTTPFHDRPFNDQRRTRTLRQVRHNCSQRNNKVLPLKEPKGQPTTKALTRSAPTKRNATIVSLRKHLDTILYKDL
jgi:hypothetical protein